MALTKTIKIEDDILAILRNSFQVEVQGSTFVGVLTCGQLERKTYERTNKVLEILGGKWSRKFGGHVFTVDPRPAYQEVAVTGAVTVAREGWFPTPRAVVMQMIELLGGYSLTGLFLEPSAGEGAIADVLFSLGVPKKNIYCVEKNPYRAEVLRQKDYQVWNEDFLTLDLSALGVAGFSTILMNPPFEEYQDITHVNHAYSMLGPRGRMVSVVSESPFFRQDQKAQGFRAWLEEQGGDSIKLEDGAFKDSGTGVNARLITLNHSVVSVLGRLEDNHQRIAGHLQKVRELVETKPESIPVLMSETRATYQTRTDSKRNLRRTQKQDLNKSSGFDQCQSPIYALDPILPYIPKSWVIWESACGAGNLTRGLRQVGYQVVDTDLLTGYNFFTYEPATYNCQLTNPPYSLKLRWLELSYFRGKPFAILMPVELLGVGAAQKLFKQFGIEVILLNRRVNFQTNKTSFAKSNAWFPTCWYTYGLGIGQQLSFGNLNKRADEQLHLFNQIGT